MDVLAVMDEALSEAEQSWGAWHKSVTGLTAAREAVKDLIHAADAFANDDRQRAWHRDYRPMMDRLRAALAKVQP